MIGKLDPETLGTILDQTGASNPALLTGAAYGEDAAAIDLGDGKTLVVSSDPISLAAEAAGTIGVHVACNDIAAAGADPEFLTNVIFLPDDDADTIETLTSQLDDAAADLGVTIVGGHTEYVPTLSRPLLSLTAFGRTDHHIPTSGAEPGDSVLLTKGAAIEATGIIATDFADELQDAGVDESTIDRAAGFFQEISILDDSRAVREYATALHDPTERRRPYGTRRNGCRSRCRPRCRPRIGPGSSRDRDGLCGDGDRSIAGLRLRSPTCDCPVRRGRVGLLPAHRGGDRGRCHRRGRTESRDC